MKRATELSSSITSSYARNWELVKSIVEQNLEEAMFVYILQREIGYNS